MNSLHQAVVGCSKTDLYTPALCLDLDLFDANVQIMVETCQKHGVVVVLAVSILCVILVFAVLVILFFIGIVTGNISPA